MTDVLRAHPAETEVPPGDLDVVLCEERSILDASPPIHAVQFYEAAPFLLDEVQRYVGPGLRRGETAVVIATAAHRRALEERLAADGLDLEDARTRGQYVALDAAETLARFMVDGTPDEARFQATVGRTIADATTD